MKKRWYILADLTQVVKRELIYIVSCCISENGPRAHFIREYNVYFGPLLKISQWEGGERIVFEVQVYQAYLYRAQVWRPL